MRLEEAIRINTVLKGAPVLEDDPLIIQALDLNIEALKIIEACRRDEDINLDDPLPGETKD